MMVPGGEFHTLTWSDAWIPLLSALTSGVLVKVVDHTFRRREQVFDDAVSIRQELRDEVHGLQRDIKSLQQELDRWRDRYYELNVRYTGVVAQCQEFKEQLDELRQHDDLRAYQQFQRALAEMRESDRHAAAGSQEGPHESVDTPDVA